MSRISYCGRDADDKAIWHETGSDAHLDYLAGITNERSNFVPDEGSFVSPIDQKVYSGRAGMREHNARHNTVNNRDLAGLPVGFDPKRASIETTRSRQERRQAIYDAAMRGGYLEGQ